MHEWNYSLSRNNESLLVVIQLFSSDKYFIKLLILFLHLQKFKPFGKVLKESDYANFQLPSF